jgi:DNA primase
VSLIPDDIIDQVRDATDIVGIIGESVELKRTGSDFRGPCPFHGGTNRNFSVVPRKGVFYCFVCHEKGDVFSYFMKRFGMDYPTAVREVARRAGIVIPERAERTGPDPNEPLYSAVAAAHDWFSRQLQEHADARAAVRYLEGRDLSRETAGELGLGFAPQGREFLDAMGALGITDEVLIRAGLAVRRDDNRTGPRFRGRLIFPIHDQRGRVVAFGGRIIGEGEPKYLNSPESEIFHKGRTLYNLHLAKHAIRKEEAVILVEGYFDVLRLALAGIEHVVAPLGTALTTEQGALLRRFAPTAILLYDSDQAGLKATFRAGDTLLKQGMRVRVATMPPGEDPDTLVRAGGAAALEPYLRDAIDVLERKIQLLDRRGWFSGMEHLRDALDRLLPTIRAAADPITRELYLSLVAERTGVGREVLVREANASAGAASQRPRGGAPGAEPAPRGGRITQPAVPSRAPFGARDEARVLEVMLHTEEWWNRAIREVRPELFEVPRYQELFRSLAEAVVHYPGQQIPEQLTPLMRQQWVKLLERSVMLEGQSVDDIYAVAVQTMEARPMLREIEQIVDPMEKKRRREEARQRFPQASKRWYSWFKVAQRHRRELRRQQEPE